MSNFKKQLRNTNYIVFMDFEGTQFSHEMIALGAVVASIDKKLRVKKTKETFKIYVKPKNKIGSVVTDLTGITEDLIKKEGVSFDTAMKEFKKYCGKAFNKAIFMTFGNHDLKILNQSISYNMVYPKDITSTIQKRFFDFTVILNEFVKDQNGNALSLVNACKLFSCLSEGTPHEPDFDAYNLCRLYDAFIDKKELVLDEYLKVLKFGHGLPDAIKATIQDLSQGKDVTAQDFREYCRKYIND